MSDFDTRKARYRAHSGHLDGIHVTLELACDEIDRLREQVQVLEEAHAQALRANNLKGEKVKTLQAERERQALRANKAERLAEARLDVLRQCRQVLDDYHNGHVGHMNAGMTRLDLIERADEAYMPTDGTDGLEGALSAVLPDTGQRGEGT